MASIPVLDCHPAQAQVVLRLADGDFEAAGVVGVARVAPWRTECSKRGSSQCGGIESSTVLRRDSSGLACEQLIERHPIPYMYGDRKDPFETREHNAQKP